MPRVSVITPVLDGVRFLRDAVGSMRAQTFADWEILLVDDGSSDGSAALARELAAADDRIVPLAHPGGGHRGASASRNLGLERAAGELIAFLDADDVFLPFKLERQVALMDAHPDVGLVYGATLFWHSPELPPHRLRPDFVGPLGVETERVYRPPELLRTLVAWEDAHPSNCAQLLRADLCREIGGFPRDVDLYEDTVFLARALLAAPAYVTGECSCVYRLHPASACHRAEANGSYDPDRPNPSERAYLEWLETEGVEDRELRRALTRRLDVYRRPRHARARRAAARARRAARRLVR